MRTTTKTARLADASPPERGVVVLHLGDGTSIRARVAVLRELMSRPIAARYVAYDVDDAGNRYNAIAATVATFAPELSSDFVRPLGAVPIAELLAGDRSTHVCAEIDPRALLLDDTCVDVDVVRAVAQQAMQVGMFVRMWKIVDATRDNGHTRVQVIDARIRNF